MKGHNYGSILCRKCGEMHIHPRGMLSKKFTCRNPEERSRKISKKLTGKLKSVKHKLKIAASQTGKKHSAKSKEKIRVSVTNTFKNMTQKERSEKLGHHGEKNPSKRPEVRVKLRGKNPKKAQFGDSNPAKRLSVRLKISAAMKKRFKDEEWLKKHIITFRNNGFGYSSESIRHLNLKTRVKKALERCGYFCLLEHSVYAKKWYIVDVVAFKEESSIAVECGNCLENKLRNLKRVFNQVFHISYEVEEVELERVLQIG